MTESWGIRYRPVNHEGRGGWKRGVQYRRVKPGSNHWVPWRSVFPSEAVANHRLKQIESIRDEHGRRMFTGHVFEIVHFPNATHYSPHFSRRELECKGVECRGKRPPANVERNLRLLAIELEKLRDELGGSLGIVSGFRCPVHNRTVHGAAQSQHMKATAADLAVPKGKQMQYVAAAKRVPAFNHGGIGIYPNGGVHVDRRGYAARWNDWVRT